MGKIIVFVAAILAGTTGPVLKLGLDSLDPISLMFIRFAIATLIFGAIYIFRKKELSWEYLKEPFKVSILSGLSLVLVIYGISKSTVSSMQAILSINPLIIAAGASRLLGESITRLKKIGLLAGLTGTFLIILQPVLYHGESLSVGSLEGNILFFIAALLGSAHVVFSKKICETHSPQVMTLSTFIIASGFFGVISLYKYFFLGQGLFTGFTIQSAWIIAYLVIFSTLLMFYLYLVGLKKTTATLVGISQYVQFLVTVVLGITFFGDSVTLIFVLGSVLILCAAWVGGRSEC